ncbi:TonB-dependent receptor [Horticoccus sp. 23ND18S-11]|uniref:TonB-dependent receptor n=1 Tax=Horticoccus sp. 23ND18S-11 TaxID=3391832 RepID=UPI0039C99E79
MRLTPALTLLTLALPTLGLAQTTPPPAGGAPQKLEAFTVTGTNLRMGESAGAANLRVLTPAEIEASGQNNLSNLLRKIPEIGAQGFAENRVNTSSPGSAAISMRGLGVNSTLVLINGRRVTLAPFGQGGSAAGLGTEQFVDLNMIPVAAIARIEVLKDGASAVYGADAVAGVVNIILKKDLTQGTLTTSYGDFTGGISAPTLRGSFFTGTKEGRTSLSIMADWMKRDEFRFGELPQPVKRQLLLASNTPGSFVVPVGATDPITGQVIPAGAAAAARTFTSDVAAPGPNATFTRQLQTQNTFDANAAIRPQSEADRRGIVATARHEFSEKLGGFVELGWQKNRNVEGLSPAPISNLNTITLPANNPFNPFGVPVVSNTTQTMFFRFLEMGDRFTTTRNKMERVVAGLDGQLAQGWTWDAAVTWNRETSHLDLKNFPGQDKVNAALADTNRATALNLFANGRTIRNNPATLAGLEGGVTRDAETKLTAIDARTTGNLFTLRSGPISVAIGGQWREEKFSDARTQVQLLNQGAPVAPANGSRRVSAAYVEASIPLAAPSQKITALHAVELNVAGRLESFSDDGVGHTTVPRVGLRWQPLPEQITFRASWGKGFRAPALAELYLPQSVAVSFNIPDPLRFGKPGAVANDSGTGQRLVRSGGNPLLAPEKSESTNFGVQFAPAMLKGLSLSVDFYAVEVKNRIGQPATPAIILANPLLFPDAAVRAAPTASDTANNLPGELREIRTVLGNYGSTKAKGVDFAAEYRFSAGRVGRFTTRAVASLINSQTLRTRPDLAQVQTVGLYEIPRWRGDASVLWNREKASASLNFNYIGGFQDTSPSLLFVKQQVTTDVQFGYALPWGLRSTIGVNNLFDRAPPATSFSTGYAERVNNFLPRWAYVSLSKTF